MKWSHTNETADADHPSGAASKLFLQAFSFSSRRELVLAVLRDWLYQLRVTEVRTTAWPGMGPTRGWTPRVLRRTTRNQGNP